jgi:hypothetical protein
MDITSSSPRSNLFRKPRGWMGKKKTKNKMVDAAYDFWLFKFQAPNGRTARWFKFERSSTIRATTRHFIKAYQIKKGLLFILPVV